LKINTKKEERKEGRVMRGLIIGIKKDIKEECKNKAEKRKTEGILLIIKKDKWNIIAIYNKQGIIKSSISEDEEKSFNRRRF